MSLYKGGKGSHCVCSFHVANLGGKIIKLELPTSTFLSSHCFWFDNKISNVSRCQGQIAEDGLGHAKRDRLLDPYEQEGDFLSFLRVTGGEIGQLPQMYFLCLPYKFSRNMNY